MLKKFSKFLNDVAVQVIATIVATLALTIAPQFLSTISPHLAQAFQTQIILTLGQTITLLGAVVFTAVVAFWCIKFIWNKRQRSKPVSIKLLFPAIWEAVTWEIDESQKSKSRKDMLVVGPLCKKCLLLMESVYLPQGKWSHGTPMVSHFLCRKCGGIFQTPPGINSEFDIRRQVYELYEAEKRKQQ